MARRRSWSTGRNGPGSGAGEFFGEVSIILGESPIADVVATRPLRCLVLAGPRVETFLIGQSAGDVADAPGAGSPAASREPMAELSAPFPPGEYPVVVIGSGPGALQFSSSLRALGLDHAVISADSSPGGMFRRWPHFQRLLSWTKPHAPVRARHARLRALRLEQPAERRSRGAGRSSPG